MDVRCDQTKELLGRCDLTFSATAKYEALGHTAGLKYVELNVRLVIAEDMDAPGQYVRSGPCLFVAERPHAWLLPGFKPYGPMEAVPIPAQESGPPAPKLAVRGGRRRKGGEA